MKLSEILDQLTQGELSQLSLGGVDANGFKECDYKKIIPHLNLALTELYKRFPLKMAEVVIQQYAHIQLYHLNSLYAQTNTSSLEPYKYIMDSEYQPFTDNVIRIEKIHNEMGEELYVNEDEAYFFTGNDKYWSVHLPTFDTIQIPYPENENQFIVTYRADHDPIIFDGMMDADSVQIPISASYLEPILLYIASRMYSNLGSMEGNEGNNYMAKYEASIKRLENLNLFNKIESTNSRLDDSGWV